MAALADAGQVVPTAWSVWQATHVTYVASVCGSPEGDGGWQVVHCFSQSIIRARVAEGRQHADARVLLTQPGDRSVDVTARVELERVVAVALAAGGARLART